MGAGTVQGTCLLQKQAMLWICHWHSIAQWQPALSLIGWLSIVVRSTFYLAWGLKGQLSVKMSNLSGATMGQFVVQRISHPGLRSCCQTLVQLAVSKQVWSAGKTWLVQFKQPSTREQYFQTVKARFVDLHQTRISLFRVWPLNFEPTATLMGYMWKRRAPPRSYCVLYCK